MRLCSACLLGMDCRYDGKNKLDKRVLDLSREELLLPVCPEQLGGLPTPREPSELVGKKALTRSGKDVTSYFLRGAEEVVRLAEAYHIREAIFKQKSPSCGCGKIYDGSFTGRVIRGDGIATGLLKEYGVRVISEEEL